MLVMSLTSGSPVVQVLGTEQTGYICRGTPCDSQFSLHMTGDLGTQGVGFLWPQKDSFSGHEAFTLYQVFSCDLCQYTA